MKLKDKSVPLSKHPYSFDIFEDNLVIFSDCCSAKIDTVEKAKEIQGMIQQWIDAQANNS